MSGAVTRSLATITAFISLVLVDAPRAHAQSSPAPPAQSAIPDTPAARVLKAYLDALNGGDRGVIDAYIKRYQPDGSAEAILQFRSITGGLDVMGIQRSEPLHIEYLVLGRTNGVTARGTLEIGAGAAGTVTKFSIRAIPKGVSLADFAIDAPARVKAIDGAVAQLNENYVFPDVARKMEEAVRAHLQHGDYDALNDGDAFADRLTTDFRAVSQDKHLSVMFSPSKLPDTPPGPNPDAAAQYRRQMERVNCGFEKVELLAGNVGYLKFNMFADPAVCGPTATAAMNFVGNADALIIDLRENGGGDPKMIAFLCSYLFAKPTQLSDVWTRKGNVTQQFWTLPYVPGKLLPDKAVYVLTAKRTFSGAEAFAYDLKNLKRATIVGEATGGGAHLVGGQRINDHFMIGVPFAQAVNPISKANWEGVGVEPDVKVPAADALSTAQKLIAERPVKM